LAANYVFAQAPANATALTVGSAATLDSPVLTGFITSLQTPPPLNPALITTLGDEQTALNAPPLPPLPRHRRCPMPVGRSRRPDAQNAEPPSSSDQVTDQSRAAWTAATHRRRARIVDR